MMDKNTRINSSKTIKKMRKIIKKLILKELKKSNIKMIWLMNPSVKIKMMWVSMVSKLIRKKWSLMRMREIPKKIGSLRKKNENSQENVNKSLRNSMIKVKIREKMLLTISLINFDRLKCKISKKRLQKLKKKTVFKNRYRLYRIKLLRKKNGC